MVFTFLNPILLWGLTAAALPLLIHLLQRRRYTTVRWAAMQFLQASVNVRSRRLRLEQLLLLLIRTLLIALVILALCRPVLHASRLAGAGREPRYAVLVLDDSFSMGYRPEGDSSTFDRARDRALELLEKVLRRGDAASVVLASDPPRALIGKPSFDLPGVAARLRALRPSDRGTNYGKSARLALELLQQSRIAQQEVYLFTDNQAAGWAGEKRDAAAWDALARKARLVVAPAAEGAAPNVAVQGVRLVRGPVTQRAPAHIEAVVTNFSTSPRAGLFARLEVDGKQTGSAEKLDLQPGQSLPVRFQYLFDKPGMHPCTVRITGDRLAADDAGYLAVQVHRDVRALVVNGAPDASAPEKDAAFFLQAALAPSSLSGEEPVAVQPTVVTDTTLDKKTLKGFDLVLLANVAVLDAESRRSLGEFAQNGGGVLIFLGDRVDPQVYNGQLLESQPRILPARLGALSGTRLTLDPASFTHAALARFRTAQDIELNTAQFTHSFVLQPDAADRSVHVMARFSNGAPALVEKQFGLGRLVLCASGVNPGWTDLPLKPAFLPLIQQLAAYLSTAAEGPRNLRLGERVVKHLPLSEANGRVTVTDPHGTDATVRPNVTAEGATVAIEDLSQAGFYRVAIAQQPLDVIAVNREPEESDLHPLREADLRHFLTARDWAWLPPAADLSATLARNRQGVELWRYLLFAAMGLMAVESLAAQMLGRRS